ncbi:MAG: S41 family peptidase [Clostridia bacterium]|jgi:carboxyl-terminal processing protease|nr:S41 family peptidase [Clostridia bacterium]
MREKSLGQKIISVVTVFCYVFTIGAGLFYFTFKTEIDRIYDVGAVIKAQYLHDVPLNQLLKGAVRGMVESLGDPYSAFMDAREYEALQEYIQGAFGGIGIYVEINKDNLLTVSSPIEGTPAYREGIKSGDVIIKIDDVFTSDLAYDEAVARMRGEPGTAVTLGIMRPGVTGLMEFKIIREIIDIPTVEHQILEDEIGYMRLKIFSSNSDEAVLEHLRALNEAGAKALVLDLRDNPGGDLDSAVNIADFFISEGPIVYIVNRSGDTRAYAAAEPEKFGLPLAVLINGGSASASEVLSGAIKDTGAGVLIGEKTFGKGIVQGVFNLGRGEGLKLTTSKYLTPNKIDIHQKGIEPDIVVTVSENDREDVQLESALEYLRKQLE